MSILTPEYIKEQAHKPCFWSEEYGFDVVAFTQAMEQNYSNRVGSKINGMKREITQLRAKLKMAEEALSEIHNGLSGEHPASIAIKALTKIREVK